MQTRRLFEFGMVVELKEDIAKQINFPLDCVKGVVLNVYPEFGAFVMHRNGGFNWCFSELDIPEPNLLDEEWICQCNYSNFGPICTKCGRGRKEQ